MPIILPLNKPFNTFRSTKFYTKFGSIQTFKARKTEDRLERNKKGFLNSTLLISIDKMTTLILS